MIQALVQRGVYVCDIARQLGVHPKTVESGAGARERADADAAAGATSLLDPYRAQVDQLLAEGVWNARGDLPGAAGAAATTAKLSILRDYIRPKRALRPSRATVRFETEPGRQLQSDWGRIRTVIGGGDDRRSTSA